MAVRNTYFRTSPVGPMYRVGMMSSSLTTATGAILGTTSYAIYSIRWASADKVMCVSEIQLSYNINTTFTTVQDIAFGLYIIRGMTADGSGGAEATIGTTTLPYMQSFDTTMGPSQLYTTGDMRICTTGALTLSAGQADAWPIQIWHGGPTNLFGVTGSDPLANQRAKYGDRPDTQQIVLRQNEGLMIQPLKTMGAGGVLDLYVTAEWSEVTVGLA